MGGTIWREFNSLPVDRKRTSSRWRVREQGGVACNVHHLFVALHFFRRQKCDRQQGVPHGHANGTGHEGRPARLGRPPWGPHGVGEKVHTASGARKESHLSLPGLHIVCPMSGVFD